MNDSRPPPCSPLRSPSRILAALIALGLLALPGIPGAGLQGLVHAGGVTVITHGLNGNVEDWIIPMADRYAGHPALAPAEVSCYELSVTSAGSTATFLGGAQPVASESGEILIKLDWSTLALPFFGQSSTFVAEAAAGALTSTTLIPELGGRSLAESPLHLIGHSRGGSVVTEIARLLGAQGIWVDQVTTLDPRPVLELGDAAVATYSNVLFADNYWQELGDGFLTPNGQALPGAYNRKLVALDGGYASSHSDAHLWYHGTIELGTPATDTGATITAAERAAWWTAAEAEGAATGFHFGRIAGGNRLNDAEPGGAGTGRVSDGINRRWDFGGGTTDNRTALPANNGLWPNIITFGVPGGIPGDPQAPLALQVRHQSGATNAGEVAIRILLDPDRNPRNGNETELHQQVLTNTGTDSVASTVIQVTPGAAGVPSGAYALHAHLSDGSRSRYLYAAETLTLGTSPGGAPFIDPGSFVVTANEVRFNVHAQPGQTVDVIATDDLRDWITIGTRLFTGTVWEFVDAERPSFDARCYAARLAP